MNSVVRNSPWSAWITNSASSTLLMFGIPLNVPARQLIALLQRYGKVNSVEKMVEGTVAMVDFANLTDASALVQMSRASPFIVGSNAVILEYCSQKLMSSQEAATLSKVVRLEISKAVHSITVEVIQTISSPIASPVRTLIGPLRENHVLTAMIEFNSKTDARRACDALNSNDIYENCCTITSTLSGLPSLLVFRNDPTSAWDFVSATFGPNEATAAAQSLLLNGGAAMMQDMYGSYNPRTIWPRSNPAMMSAMASAAGAAQFSHFFSTTPRMPHNAAALRPLSVMSSSSNRYNANAWQSNMHRAPINPSEVFVTGEGCVVFFNNLFKEFTCDRLFNLCCVYGNVARIKFLKSREGVAMVQMGSPHEADNLIAHLNGLSIFNQKISLSASNQAEIVEGPTDANPFVKNYMNSPSNRFRLGSHQEQNRIVPPTPTLHFFNAPLGVDEVSLRNVFSQAGAPVPDRVVIFPTRPGQKSAMGLIEYDSLKDALEAMVYMNNIELKDGNRPHPYHLKLAFSSKPVDTNRVNNGEWRKRCSATNGSNMVSDDSAVSKVSKKSS